eukprot:TRINITY_DN1867_c0_g1_i4.p1 TRINITY_DN1867_c0_g1~~TRINITY_DN1867_c0_g1_i4.p1  ORF type:complete len:1022 (+),score=259.51 TRINITY_DN1867_c0_g1_i4:28-3066(+)
MDVGGVDLRPWHSALDPLPPHKVRTAKRGKTTASEDEAWMKLLEQNLEIGRVEYEKHAQESEKSGTQTSEKKWMKTILRSGTSSDRSAAMMVCVQEAPFENLRTLRAIVGLASKKGRREAITAATTLKDLFIYNLLPDRKLVFFRDQDYQNPAATPRHFMYWYFENELKKCYAEFISSLEVGTKDSITHHKNQVLHFLYELLLHKPEQEQTLLSLLVNKLGDPEKKISSKIVYLLGQLVQKHPNMQPIVISEIDVFLHRPNLSSRAQYCAIIFLNQLVLDGRHPEVALKLIGIYFSLFKTCVELGEVQSKMLSALLSGVSRALPFARCDTAQFREHVETLFRIVTKTTLNKAIQALMLLLQLFTYAGPPPHVLARQKLTIEEQQEREKDREETLRMESRFYRALYNVLLSPDLFMSSKQALFLNVLYKAMKTDRLFPRLVAFTKRILQVCLYQKPPFISGALFMLAQIANVKPQLKTWLRHFAKHQEENTLMSGGKVASDEAVVSNKKNAETNGVDSEAKKSEDPAEEEEEEAEKDEKDEKEKKPTETSTAEQPVKDPKKAWNNIYDPLKREPEFSNSNKSCAWELRALSQHYHPAVARFAQALMTGNLETELSYQGDPLQDFTLGAFLERFSFRNPKQKVSDGSGSLMQPRMAPRWTSEVPVNDPKFVRQNENKVRAEELFFYNYFKTKAAAEAEEHKKLSADGKQSKRDQDQDDEAFDAMEHEIEGGESLDRKFSDLLKSREEKEPGTYSYDDLDLSDLEEGGDAAEGRYDDEEDDDFYEQHLMRELEEEAEAGAFDDDLDSAEFGRGSEDFKDDGGEAGDFADAEEFAHLLEESGRDYDAPTKQMKWELKTGKTAGGSSAGSATKKRPQREREGEREREEEEDDGSSELDELDAIGFDEIDMPADAHSRYSKKHKGGVKRKRTDAPTSGARGGSNSKKHQGAATKKPRRESSSSGGGGGESGGGGGGEMITFGRRGRGGRGRGGRSGGRGGGGRGGGGGGRGRGRGARK